MLDKYSISALIRKGHKPTIDNCLNDPNLSDEHKYDIAYHGDDEQVDKLIKNHKLDSDEHDLIIAFKHSSHHTTLLKHQKLNNSHKRQIYKYGTQEQKEYLTKHLGYIPSYF